jgi:glycosyltransferase involved in cell wall biosynthesis
MISLGMGGAERQTLALAERMASVGHRVSILILREQLREQWPTHVPVEYLGMRKNPWSFLLSLVRASRALSRLQPEIVHSHGFHANLVARLLRLRYRQGVLIGTIHNVYEGGRVRMLLYRLTDSLVDRVTAVSQAAARRFIAVKAVSAAKCTVVANGIDLAEFVPNERRRAAMRSEIGCNDKFVWLAAGRIVPAKDFSNLLEAFALVQRQSPHARLLIAGETKGDEFVRLTALEIELGFNEPIGWLGLRRDLPALLDAADGFVLSSAWEGMPLALGEAMAMGKPCVATDVGGVRELAGDTGRIVPARDALQLSQAMLAVQRASKAERAAQGRAARQRIEKEFSIDARADTWEEFYRSAIGMQEKARSRP